MFNEKCQECSQKARFEVYSGHFSVVNYFCSNHYTEIMMPEGIVEVNENPYVLEGN